MGKIPPAIIRWGIAVITLILSLLFMAAFLVPYPRNLKAEVILSPPGQEGNYIACARLPYFLIDKVKAGMPVRIELEGYPAQQYGYLEGQLDSVGKEVITGQGQNYFPVTIAIDPSSGSGRELRADMAGTASILVTDKSFASYFFKGR